MTAAQPISDRDDVPMPRGTVGRSIVDEEAPSSSREHAGKLPFQSFARIISGLSFR